MPSRRHRSAGSTDKEEILQHFPRINQSTQQLIRRITKGKGVLLLRLRIMDLLLNYASITLRMVFYRLISIYNYPNDRRFYKRLGYSLKRIRKLLPEVNQKFEDPSRPVRIPGIPNPKLELFLEKASLEYFLRKVTDRYHVPTLAEKGFGSLSMFRKAIERARKRAVKKVLFVSDHDPSGLKIEEVTRKELPLIVERIALTMEQIKKYRLPAIRVKRSDSRAKKYIEVYGDNAWEVEALPPKALLRIVEQKLTENIPKEFLDELRLRAKVEKITRPLERKLIEKIRTEAARLKKEGKTDEKILERLIKEFTIGGV